MAPLSDG
jgi:hypothetical protein